jgi:hypothetical protein
MRKLLISLAFLFVLISLFQGVCAVIAVPGAMINNHTKQCALLVEPCMICDFPYPYTGNEWKPAVSIAACPTANLTRISLADTGLTFSCRTIQKASCCDNPHLHGNCTNLVINHDAKQCSIVIENFNKTPKTWEKKPEGVSYDDWLCPSGYAWIDSEKVAPTGVFQKLWSGILQWWHSLGNYRKA